MSALRLSFAPIGVPVRVGSGSTVFALVSPVSIVMLTATPILKHAVEFRPHINIVRVARCGWRALASEGVKAERGSDGT
jgi:hypothetical protein